MLSESWLIFGICGQDGSYFADFLLNKGYSNIHGVIRRAATFNTSNIDHVFDKLKLHYGDLTDSLNIYQLINTIKPDYIVNFAAQSHVKVSHSLPQYTIQVNTLGVLNILEAVRQQNLNCKIYQASTSEMFGNTTDGSHLLNESSSMNPVSIYGISKLASQHLCNMYRDAYNMFIVASILNNHESPRRGHTFVTQKISNYVGKYIKKGMSNPLELGNLNARRDWGDARDYVECIYLMLKEEKPCNYVIATGETHSVREFVEIAFKQINIEIVWSGSGLTEIGKNAINNDILIVINPKYYRDIDIECLIGDSSLAKKHLQWYPKTSFLQLVKDMVNSSIERS
jgi:GDPmannose 4,6-dehydratase